MSSLSLFPWAGRIGLPENQNIHRAGSASQSLIAESVPRAQMEMIPSITQQECHAEPLSCVLKVGDGVVTLCYGGILKFWKQS